MENCRSHPPNTQFLLGGEAQRVELLIELLVELNIINYGLVDISAGLQVVEVSVEVSPLAGRVLQPELPDQFVGGPSEEMVEDVVVPLILRRTNHPRLLEQVILDACTEDLPLFLSEVEEDILAEATRIIISDSLSVAE
jgi:hypothetical protein